MKQATLIQKLLLAAFAVETFCATYALLLPVSIGFTSVLYLLSGLMISLLPVLLPEAELSFAKRNGIKDPHFLYKLVGFCIGIAVIVFFCKKWMDDAPMDYHDADMLPIMKIMNQRLLNGQRLHVYDTIPEIWKGIQPVYLPAMWLPFGIPVWLNADLRWVTVFCLIIVYAIFLLLIDAKRKANAYVLLAAFVLFWWLLVQEDASGLIPYTEEGVIILYYSLLTVALLNKNVWLIAVSISLCVLSRYALIGFLPPFVLLLLYERKVGYFIKLSVTGIVLLLLLFIMPFGWNIFVKLLSLPSEYVGFAARVWHDAPQVFYKSLGLAKFFGSSHIALQHTLLIVLVFLLPFLFAAVCVWLKKKGHQMANLNIAIFKLSLVVFYNLIDVPYLYLFYTSSFVSLILVVYFMNANNAKASS